MNPKHGESVRDPDTGELLVWRTLPAEARRARSNITIVRGVHSGELRMLCTLLRDNRPLAPEVREAVAAMLEKLFWNEPSGASESRNNLHPTGLVDASVYRGARGRNEASRRTPERRPSRCCLGRGRQVGRHGVGVGAPTARPESGQTLNSSHLLAVRRRRHSVAHSIQTGALSMPDELTTAISETVSEWCAFEKISKNSIP